MTDKSAKFGIGAIVKHRLYPFRGVVVDVDPEFDNTDEWYESIPAELRPDKAQPFYHLLAENSDSYYTAYVSQQNLLPDAETAQSATLTLTRCLMALMVSVICFGLRPLTKSRLSTLISGNNRDR